MSMLSPEELARLSLRRIAVSVADPGAVGVERRVHAVAADRAGSASSRRASRRWARSMAKRLGMSRRRILPDRGGHGGGVPRDERHLRPDLRRVARRGRRARSSANERAKQLSDQFIMDMHTHFLRPGTRIMTFVNQRERGGQGRLEPRARRQGADDRRSDVHELPQGDLPRQRHQGRVHQRRALGGSGGLVPHQRDEGAGARRRERPGAAASACSRTRSSRRATTAGWSRSITRIAKLEARFDEGLHDRRQHQQEPLEAPVAPRRREARLPGVREVRRRPGSRTSASTRACSRRRWKSSSRTCSRTADVRDVAKAAKDWPQLNFIIYHGGYRWAGGGNVEDAWAQFEQTGRDRMGHRPRPRSRRSTAYATSTPTWASCSRNRRSPIRACRR